jgi:hypothetical protein
MRKTLPPEQPSLGAEFDIEPSHRLLFAIRPDVGATGRLTCLMERLRHDGIMPGSSVEPDRLHITLHHLGDFGDQLPPRSGGHRKYGRGEPRRVCRRL